MDLERRITRPQELVDRAKRPPQERLALECRDHDATELHGIADIGISIVHKHAQCRKEISIQPVETALAERLSDRTDGVPDLRSRHAELNWPDTDIGIDHILHKLAPFCLATLPGPHVCDQSESEVVAQPNDDLAASPHRPGAG